MKRLFILMLLMLGLVSSVNATIEDNFNRNDNSTLGTATNGNTWSQTATTWSINNNTLSGSGTAADGTAQLLLSSSNPTRIDYEFYIGNSTTDAYYQKFGDNSGISVGNYGIFLSIVSGNIKYYSGGWTDFPTPITPSINIWYNVSLRNINYVADTFDIYWDGVLKGSGSFSANVGITHAEFDRRVETGRIDCLTTNGSSCIVTPTTPTITSDLQTYYNTSNITINLNTSPVQNTNISYVLNTGNETSICNDCNNSQVNFTGLSEGLNNVTWISTDSSGQVNTTENFTIDLTVPVIQKINNISSDSFAVNFSEIFNVTDNLSGLASCTINITELSNVTTPDNFFINCTDTQTFNSAGDHNLFLLATDNAGNTNSFVENFTISPIVSIFFNDTVNSTILLNYSATIFHPDGRTTNPNINVDGSINLTPVNNGSLDLGVHTIQFERLGFATENFSTNITESSGGETIIFNVTRSQITLQIFDRTTLALLTGLSEVTLVPPSGGVGFNGSTTTGLLNISDINFLSGTYQVITQRANYTTESIFFVYSNQENLAVDTFLLELNLTQTGFVVIKAVSDEGPLIEGALCKALQWIPSQSAFITTAQGNTNTNGETILNIEIGTELYKFTCTKAGQTVTSNQQIIQASGVTVPLTFITLAEAPEIVLENFVGNLTNVTLNSTHQQIIFSYNDPDGTVNEACIKIIKKTGTQTILVSETCSTSSTGEIQLVLDINNTFTLEARATAEVDGFVTTVDKITFLGTGNIEEALKEWGLAIMLPFLFMCLGLSLGFMTEPKSIILSVFGGFAATWLAVAIVPSIISFSIGIFITLILIIVGIGARKNK